MPKTIKIEATVAKLRKMDFWDMTFWGTPEAYTPYAESQPRYRSDVRLATPEDFIKNAGWDELAECNEDGCNEDCSDCAQVLSLEVEV